MSGLGDFTISKTVNLIPTDMSTFLKIKISEKKIKNRYFSKNFKKFFEKKSMLKFHALKKYIFFQHNYKSFMKQ